jgi:hypothetical protein
LQVVTVLLCFLERQHIIPSAPPSGDVRWVDISCAWLLRGH